MYGWNKKGLGGYGWNTNGLMVYGWNEKGSCSFEWNKHSLGVLWVGQKGLGGRKGKTRMFLVV